MHSHISPFAVLLLTALAWSSLVFCGEIHDAAKAEDLAKVKALLKENPELIIGAKANTNYDTAFYDNHL